MSLQGLVPMSLGLVAIATGGFIRRRLRLGFYPADKVAMQRVVMWLFLVTGVAGFIAALVRSITY